jgi:hypothetical protein
MESMPIILVDIVAVVRTRINVILGGYPVAYFELEERARLFYSSREKKTSIICIKT